ncbi:uncharacterized protein LOC127001634 isoform X2 [Eriocheir sinensis]|uniref:uncharacterized protein LOC127001634 isoform X2 n=1 Tax=Eriocheir sinensis TaxID=95602 RepID=UPI0021C7DAAC|nr:uncharacterized protein LOC127001634 isoform X2 [Eriocheir sinensis]
MEDSLDPLGADPSELKMAELRAELQARGLDPKGNRPMLVERLRAAQEEESAGDLSDNGNWLDLKLEEGPIWIKEEALDMKEEPLETEESEMTARRGEKRSLSHSCPPEAAQGAKMQRLEVKNEPQYCETVVSTDWTDQQDTEDEEEEEEERSQGWGKGRSRSNKKQSSLVILEKEVEAQLSKWLVENPILYSRGHNNSVKKVMLFEEKAKSLNPPLTGEQLRRWFDTMRTRYGKLTNPKSGSWAHRLPTDRDKWIMRLFSFLDTHIVRHKGRTRGCKPQEAAAEGAAPEGPTASEDSRPSTRRSLLTSEEEDIEQERPRKSKGTKYWRGSTIREQLDALLERLAAQQEETKRVSAQLMQKLQANDPTITEDAWQKWAAFIMSEGRGFEPRGDRPTSGEETDEDGRPPRSFSSGPPSALEETQACRGKKRQYISPPGSSEDTTLLDKLVQSHKDAAECIERRIRRTVDRDAEFWKVAITDGLATMLRNIDKDFAPEISVEVAEMVCRYTKKTKEREASRLGAHAPTGAMPLTHPVVQGTQQVGMGITATPSSTPALSTAATTSASTSTIPVHLTPDQWAAISQVLRQCSQPPPQQQQGPQPLPQQQQGQQQLDAVRGPLTSTSLHTSFAWSDLNLSQLVSQSPLMPPPEKE